MPNSADDRSARSFASFAQNGEDVVLWRALHDVTPGRYLEVGANDPSHESVTRAFYDAGWRGITIEPMPSFAAMHRQQRPEDRLVEAAITSQGSGTVTLHEIEGSGLSTLVDDISAEHGANGFRVQDIEVPAYTLNKVLEDAGWDGLDIHFMTVDVEGAEPDVMASIDLHRWRPWVLVIEATRPLTTEPVHGAWEPAVLAAGYEFCLFDGLSRFYVAREHADRLPLLSYPATLLDDYSTSTTREMAREIAELKAELHRVNAISHENYRRLVETDDQLNTLREEHARVLAHLEALTGSLSWRATGPLRSMREKLGRGQAT